MRKRIILLKEVCYTYLQGNSFVFPLCGPNILDISAAISFCFWNCKLLGGRTQTQELVSVSSYPQPTCGSAFRVGFWIPLGIMGRWKWQGWGASSLSRHLPGFSWKVWQNVISMACHAQTIMLGRRLQDEVVLRDTGEPQPSCLPSTGVKGGMKWGICAQTGES